MRDKTVFRLLIALVALTCDFFAADRLLSAPWRWVYLGVQQLVVLVILVWLVAVVGRDRRWW